MTLEIKPSDIARSRPAWWRHPVAVEDTEARCLILATSSLREVTAISWSISSTQGNDVRSRTVVLPQEAKSLVDNAVASIVLSEITAAIDGDYLLRVHVSHGDTREVLIQAMADIPNLAWLSPEGACRLETVQLHDVKQRAARTVERRATAEIIATDASKRTGHSGAGLGVFVENRLAIVDFAPSCRSVLEGELQAILLGITSVRAGRIIIQSDSQQAVRLLTDAKNGRQSRSLRDCPGRVRQVIDLVTAASRERDIQFQWVRGHSDNVNNRTADRLAVLARRSANAGASHETVKTVMRNIVAEEIGSVDGVGVKVRNLETTLRRPPHTQSTDTVNSHSVATAVE